MKTLEELNEERTISFSITVSGGEILEWEQIKAPPFNKPDDAPPTKGDTE